MRKAVASLVSLMLIMIVVLTACTTEEPPVTTTTTSTPTTTTTTISTTTTTTTPTTTTTTTTAVTGPTYGGTINYLYTTDPGSFDNIRFHGPGEATQSFYLEKLLMGNWGVPREQHAFMGAYVSEENGTGALAESWENPDPLTYIIHLRRAVYWQNKPPVNGREFVASDVVYTYGRQLGRGIGGFETGSPYQNFPMLNNVVNVTAKDKYTVVFELSAPIPLLIENLGLVDHIKMIPREVVDKYGNLDDWRNAVGTGPFILHDYVSGSSVTFRKNPDYWGFDELNPENRLPYADFVRQSIIVDASTSLAAFRTGKVDLRLCTGTERASLTQTNPELMWKPNPVVGIVLAMRNDIAPFDNIKVRKALQMAIDLPTIAEQYYNGHTLGWFAQIIGPGLPMYTTPFEEYPQEVQDGFTYNPTGAKALLAEAGFPNGFNTEIITSPYMPNDLVELTQDYLAQVGVNMEMKTMDLASWTAFVYSKQHQAMAVYMAAWQGSPFETLNLHYPGHIFNLPNVNDPVYTEMVDKARAEPNAPARDAIVKEAVKYGTSQFWVVRLPVYVDYMMWHPWLGNFQGESALGAYNQGGVYARLYINQALKNQ